MAVDVKASLRAEMSRFRQTIAKKTSELASLNDALRRYERALELLGDEATRARTRPAKTRKSALVNWNIVLSQLPNSFSLKDVSKRPESKGKNPVYLRKIASRWAKAGKTKRISPGKYQRVEQKKVRAT